jgi:hypothetical protein
MWLILSVWTRVYGWIPVLNDAAACGMNFAVTGRSDLAAFLQAPQESGVGGQARPVPGF